MSPRLTKSAWIWLDYLGFTWIRPSPLKPIRACCSVTLSPCHLVTAHPRHRAPFGMSPLFYENSLDLLAFTWIRPSPLELPPHEPTSHENWSDLVGFTRIQPSPLNPVHACRPRHPVTPSPRHPVTPSLHHSITLIHLNRSDSDHPPRHAHKHSDAMSPLHQNRSDSAGFGWIARNGKFFHVPSSLPGEVLAACPGKRRAIFHCPAWREAD